MSNHRKLKSYILLPRFQFVFVALNWIVLLATVFFAYFTVHSSFENMREIGRRMKLQNDSGYMKFISAQEEFFFNNMLLFGGIALAVSLVITIILSHRVAGPIYRLKKHFQDMDRDNPKPVSFRKGDFFSELPEIINDKIVKK